jgi:hypothetical protein
MKQIVYCYNPGCPNYMHGQFVQVIIPPYIPMPDIMLDQMPCEECGERVQRIPDIDVIEDALFSHGDE